MSSNENEKKQRPLFSFGWGAAHGTIAFGGGLSVGVVAIGGNAIGSLVAIGGNAVAPISFGLINSVGIVAVGGVNALGPWAIAGVNGMGEPRIALVFAIIFAVVMGVLRVAKRTKLGVRFDEPPPPWVSLAKVIDQTEVWTRAIAHVTDGPDASTVTLRGGGRFVTVRVSMKLNLAAEWNEKELFVLLRGQPRPKADAKASDYRHASTVMEYEAIEARLAPEPRRWPTRLGLTPWTIWNTQLAFAVILTSVLAYLSR
jgi:hypothetical protein